mgnify:CR=1 FL=1
MTKQELIGEVCKRSEINDIDFGHGFNNLIEVIKKTIAKGEAIHIRGFGTLKPVERKAKPARNILTGETVIVPARKEPVFKASKEFKKQVNQ